MSKLLSFIREAQEPKELYEPSEIKKWMDANTLLTPEGAGPYKILGNKHIDVSGNIIIALDTRIVELPVKFDNVAGDFDMSNCKVTSLKGCPDHVGGIFNCSENNITTLSLCPSYIGKNLIAYSCQLVSLSGCPEVIYDLANFADNQLISMTGGPKKVIGDLSVISNKISTFEGFPAYIGGDLYITKNQFATFKHIHKHIKELHGEIICDMNRIQGNVLGVFNIKGLKRIIGDVPSPQWVKIVNKHLASGNDGAVYDCQEELIDAGLEEYAKL